MGESDRDEQIQRLFEQVVEEPTSARRRILDASCPDDIRPDVERLLHIHDGATAVFSRPAIEQLLGLQAAVPTPADPDTLNEFKILRRLGAGGMGTVYLAHDTSLQRQVAIKVLSSRYSSDPERIARFTREARTAAKIRHPRITRILKSETSNGLHYLVMDYIDGPNLGELLTQMPTRQEGHGAPLHDKAHFLRQANIVAKVADAVDHIHQLGIIHRDIKPTNILIDSHGEPYLSDFGIARPNDESELTGQGQIIGTLAYMSPEQARAESEVVDQRSDVFSLGIVLYELLTFKRPFTGSDAESLRQDVIAASPARVRQVNRAIPPDLETICHKALEPLPIHRYQTAAQLAGDLRCFCDGLPILARRPSPGRIARQWLSTHRVPALVVSTLTLLLVSSLLAAYVARTRTATLTPVRVDSSISGARVVLLHTTNETLRLDNPKLAGETPTMLRLAPGYYRIAVVAATGFREFDVFLPQRGEQRSLNANFSRPVDTQNMILVSGGSYAFGADNELFPEQVIELDSFYLDRTEVSNAEYLRFVEATNHSRPGHWPEGRLPEERRDYPVVGITWDDALRYAEWCGKRLPTIFEWECAMRAPSGRLLPWPSDEAPVLPSVSREDLARFASANMDLCLEQYLKHSSPVSQDPSTSTALGFLHSSSNVCEYTSTIVFWRSNGIAVKGASWVQLPQYHHLAHTALSPHGTISMKTGFRCARSVQPPQG